MKYEKKEVNKADEGRRWLNDLKLAKREDEKWCKRGDRIIKRYRDERTEYARGSEKRYNILWANVQTLLPALYGKTPRAQVERRWKDQDPIGRTASVILERALQFEIDHYGEFDAASRSAVLDRLLSGRGTAWIRYEMVQTILAEGEPGPEQGRTPVDYVFWKDFRCSPARTWEEVTWVARRVYMSRGEGIERFGEDFKDVPLSHEPIGIDELKNQGSSQSEIESLKKAPVWEIWDKGSKCVYWVAEGYSTLLDYKEDPYGLDNFWPCPKPLYATQTTDTIVPIPDYALYQDQAEELDRLTQRISMLTAAVKVVGVYDATQEGIQRMLTEGVDNTLIPVSTWAAFGEKGGLKGTVDFLPIDVVVRALNECYVAREQAKQVIYEVTGLSDILRGASVASETATAQQIKSQYASLRLKRLQIDVAEFTSAILRIKAQLMSDLYTPEALIEMSGIAGTQDAQYAEQAVQLLKTEPIRTFRIEVASDSLVEMDEAGEKESRVEFLTAVGTFMERSLPVAQQVPEMAPLIGEMLLFGVRAFKGGRPMEAAFDDAIAKLKAPKEQGPPPPDPEQIKAEAAMQLEQMRQQAEQGKVQASAQIEQFKAQNTGQIEQMKMAHAMELEQMRQAAESERAKYKADVDAQVRLQIAAMQDQQSKEARAFEAEKYNADGQRESERIEAEKVDLSPFVESMNKLGEQVAEIQAYVTAPVKIERDPKTGRAVGVNRGGVVKPIKRGADGRMEGI
jgi:hypothetical protein